MSAEESLTRLRIWYAKSDALRYTGHLDMQRTWERTLRRARLPLAYSLGFHPQPRLHQACALPLGFTSLEEIVDVWFEGQVDSMQAAKAIQTAAPPGLEVHQVAEIDLQAPALQTEVRSVEYCVEILHMPAGLPLADRVVELLASSAIPRERRGKPYDLRPLIELLSCDEASGKMQMRLAARENATGRPEEVLAALGLDPNDSRVQRTKILFG